MDSPAPGTGLSLVPEQENVSPPRPQLCAQQGESGEAVLRPEASLADLFAHARDASAIGFVLAQIASLTEASGPVLWVQDRMVALNTGRLCGAGVAGYGLDPERLLLACAPKPADLLWSLEEGLKSTALVALVGELWGNPRALDFTATKRLAMRAERRGVPVFLLRFGAEVDLSVARRRWRIASLPSAPHPHDAKAPGSPRWRAELFRARGVRPGIWQVGYDAAGEAAGDGAPRRLRILPAPADGTLADPQRAAG